MLIDITEQISVKVYYKKMGKTYVAFTDYDFKKQEFSDDEKAKWHELNVRMKPLTWGEHNSIQSAARSYDNMGKPKWSDKQYKEKKLVSLMLGWDAKMVNPASDKNEMIAMPSSEANILRLAPSIAEAILDGYDYVSELGEDEKKN